MTDRDKRIKLHRDIMPDGYNWPDGQLAVWKLVTRDAWVAAPPDGATDGTLHKTAEEAALSVGAVLATVGELRDCGSPEVDEDLHDLLYEQDPEIYTKIVAVLRSMDALRAELAREGGKGG